MKANVECNRSRHTRQTPTKVQTLPVPIVGYILLAAVMVKIMEIEKEQQDIKDLAEILMQSKNLEASIILLNDFAYKCYQQGALEAQNDAASEIRENYVERSRM